MAGFTKIDNDLLEKVAQSKFNGTQYRILLTVWRNTYGWNQKEKDMSLTFLSKATNIHKKQIEREINALIEMNVIMVVKEATFNSSRIISFNEDFTSWNVDSKQESGQVTKKQTLNETEEWTGNELATSTVSELATQERKNLKKELKKDDDRPIPENLYQQVFAQPLTPVLIDDFKYWVEESEFKDPEEILCETINRIAKEHPRNPSNYLRSSVNTLLNLKLFTIDAVKEYYRNFDNKYKKKKSLHDIPTERPSDMPKPEPVTEDELSRIKELEEELPF